MCSIRNGLELTARSAFVFALACALLTPLRGDETGVDFFERKIRPVLVGHCYSCHSAEAMDSDKLKGGLRLDAKQSAFLGGDSGEAIVPNDAQSSLLMSALNYESLEMPPKGKLPDHVVRNFEKWINDGAAWPDDHDVVASEKPRVVDYAKSRQQHWAWKPLQTRLPNRVHGDSWSQNMIDRCVLHELRKNDLTPSSSVTKASWFRRVHFDLLGVPPRYDEVVAFENDTRPDAYERVVDRLLVSPRYGERWARHWLDIARYADNGGFNSQTKELYTDYPFAFTYRDYVIASFNKDLPYDQFIIEQLAADKLSLGEDNRPLAALGFLTLGDASFGVSREDRIDDCIDTVTRGLMATTVSCARCHDHKYDPIPTADYYSLFGVFKNSNVRVLSRLHTIEKSQKLPALFASAEERETFERALESAENELDSEKLNATQRSRQHFLDHFAEYLLAERGQSAEDETKLDKDVIERIKKHLDKDKVGPGWSVWKAFRSLGKSATTAEINRVLSELEKKSEQVDSTLLVALKKRDLRDLKDVAEVFATIVRDSESSASETQQQVDSVWIGEQSPFKIDGEWLLKTNVHNRKKRLVELTKKRDTIRFAQPRAAALTDTSNISESHILIRGTAGKRGDVVPRQFLALLSEDRRPFENGSGRLELAHAIVDKKNPLTARVMVNRIWLHLIGQGIVETPGDFGTRCDEPVHLDLLDYLADYFMSNDWSIKKVQRLIVLSNTYRQASGDRQDVGDIDPENRLLWRMNRKRLSFETLRDSLLISSGNYDLSMFGAAEDLWTSNRRTIYGYVNRYRIADGYLTFDFPNPSRTADKRLETMVPQQSLFLMNSPFVESWVNQLVDHEAFKHTKAAEERITFLFRRILSRDPQPSELRAGLEFLGHLKRETESKEPWRQMAHGLFLSNEFMYID